MRKRVFQYTLIKRGHLVLQNGVGSIVRSSSGTTAIVAGLPEWQYTLTKFKDSEAEALQYLRKNMIREPELEAATGIRRFIPPPAKSDDKRTWEIPLIRFPKAGVCAGWMCGRLKYADDGTPLGSRWKCTECKGKRPQTMKQVSAFLVCPAGHIDEIAWHEVMPHSDGCSGQEIQLSNANRTEIATARCLECGAKGKAATTSCTGTRPWLPNSPAEECSEEMFVTSRASVGVFFPNMRSAIHIPVETPLDEDVLEFLRLGGLAEAADITTDGGIQALTRALATAGYVLTPDHAVAHLKVLRDDATEEEPWDFIASRGREFDVLSGQRKYPALDSSPLISLEEKDLTQFSGAIFSSGLIGNVTAVHKLTETRVLNGFSRKEPRAVQPRVGRLQMWGRDTTTDDWLPGYRTFGEGIFLQFRLPKLQLHGAGEGEAGAALLQLSPAGVWVHTFAHLLITQLAEFSGYAVPSIRDRVYDLDGGRLGILIYTSEGDSMGTLGGLVAHCAPGILEPLLERTLEAAGWCAQDPVCRETTLDAERHISAACHQCALLPETSCELFNSYLDRNLLMDYFH